MLKVAVGTHVLFSHWLETVEEYSEEELEDLASKHQCNDWEQLGDAIEKDLNERYADDLSGLKGDVGDGSFYPGNAGHDEIHVEDFEFSDDLKERLVAYMANRDKSGDTAP